MGVGWSRKESVSLAWGVCIYPYMSIVGLGCLGCRGCRHFMSTSTIVILSTVAWFWSILHIGDSSNPSDLRPLTHFGPMAALSDQVRPSDSATPHALFAHGSLARPGPTLQMCDPSYTLGPWPRCQPFDSAALHTRLGPWQPFTISSTLWFLRR